MVGKMGKERLGMEPAGRDDTDQLLGNFHY